MSDTEEGLERIGDRLRPDHPLVPVQRPGLGNACGNFAIAAVVLVVSLCFSCSCKPKFFKEAPKVEADEEFMGNTMGGFGGSGSVVVPTSDHVTDAAGNLLRSTATGRGFRVEWSTPETPGATTEQVLDAVLSRMQNLNQLGLGNVDLAKHIYSVDKLLEEMRNGDFAGYEAKLHLLGRRGPPGQIGPPGSTAAGLEGEPPADVVEEDTAPPRAGGSGFPPSPGQ